MRRLTIPEFRAELKAQGVPDVTHAAVKCPICATVQSIADFVAAGATEAEAAKAIGWECIGRYTGAGPFKQSWRKQAKGCDWTLGGFLQFHDLEVIDELGKAHPRFEPATPAEAQAHAARQQTRAA